MPTAAGLMHLHQGMAPVAPYGDYDELLHLDSWSVFSNHTHRHGRRWGQGLPSSPGWPALDGKKRGHEMRKGRFLGNSLLAVLLVAAATSLAAAGDGKSREPLCSDTTCSTFVYIDLFDAAHTTNAPTGSPWILPNTNNGKGVSVGRLINGQTYLVTVSGWVSYWFKYMWDDYGTFGIPIQPPLYYSSATGAPSHAEQTQAGYDWHCLFAYPKFPGAPAVNLPAPYASSRVSLDGGQTYGDLVQLGGLQCSPDHTYRYLVVGQGQEGFFRISDTGPTHDNYGKYRICVQAVCCASEDCKNPVPASLVVDPALMTNGAFDPRLVSGPLDR